MGDPLATFRYDQDFEFIDAIRNQPPVPPVATWTAPAAQAVMDAAVQSAEQRVGRCAKGRIDGFFIAYCKPEIANTESNMSRTAIVTGAGSGVGQAVGLHMAPRVGTWVSVGVEIGVERDDGLAPGNPRTGWWRHLVMLPIRGRWSGRRNSSKRSSAHRSAGCGGGVKHSQAGVGSPQLRGLPGM